MAFKDELKLHFDARIAVVNVVTSEESRVLQELAELANGPGWSPSEGLYTWDVADQFQCLRPAKDPFDTAREALPDAILRMIDDFAGSATFVLKDFHQVWQARPEVLRAIRNLAARLPESAPRKNIVITTPEHCLPVELKHDVPVLELAKPDALEMDALIERTVGDAGVLRDVKPALRAKLVEAALGLTSTQARWVFQKAVVSSGASQLDERCIDLIMTEKRAIIRESGALELYPRVESAERVGGLDALKLWLEQRQLAFAQEAREYGLDAPRGVALCSTPEVAR